jgi:hypothetical protein
MKRFISVAIIIALYSCSASKEAGSNQKLSPEEKKMTDMIVVKKAVESRRFIVKAERIYVNSGAPADLQPDRNFIIINGELASISLPYIGRSFGRPVSGINFDGQTARYEMRSDSEKGIYDIKVIIRKGGQTFDIYLTVGFEGLCTFSLNNAFLETTSYKGYLVPIPVKLENQDEEQVKI